MAGIEILGDGGRKSMPNATLSPAEWFCIKIASDKSHLNVSLIVSSKAEVGCPQIIKFGEKKEKKRRGRTWESNHSRPHISLTPYSWAAPAHNRTASAFSDVL